MKNLLIPLFVMVCVASCTSPPMYIVDDFHGKKIVRCDSDALCLRGKYSVAWDYSCQSDYYSYNSCGPYYTCNSWNNNCNSDCKHCNPWYSNCSSFCRYCNSYRNTYGNSNSHYYNRYSGGYPVSYRNKEYTYENDPNGYAVTLPEGGNISIP